MHVEITLTHEPIGPAGALPCALNASAGAQLQFLGIVRSVEDGWPIAALEYEAYPEMAVREMRRIVDELAGVHRCLAVTVIHRLGVIPVSEAAICVQVAATHRAEAFALLTAFMDRLKQNVPIWKVRAVPAMEPSNTEGRMNIAPTTNVAGSVEHVVDLVRANCQALAAERVPLATTLDRVLREPVCAPEDQPAFDRSAMDGFAVRLDDAGTRFRVVDEIRAGDWKSRQLQPCETVRISTGGALPGEDLQVLMKEDVQIEADGIHVLRRDQRRHVRFRGEDAQKGQVLVEAGTRLQPGTLALLASIGHTEPLVTRRPRVLHVATGNEIVPPDQTPRPGQIRDSNSTLVRTFLQQWNVEPVQLRVPEDEAAAESAIRDAQSTIDLLLVSGGASVGEHDFTRRLFERLGWRVHLARTNTRPGKPLIFATREHGLAFGLPGNPLAHFVCLNLFVRAALDRLAGLPDRELFAPAVLAVELASDGSARETLWPAVVSHANARIEITPLRWSSSGDITSLARANALLRVPAGATQLAAGSPVTFASATFPP